MLVCAANGLIGFVTYMYLTVLAPNYLRPRLGLIGTGVVVSIGLFILFNILFNYWVSHFPRAWVPLAATFTASLLPPTPAAL